MNGRPLESVGTATEVRTGLKHYHAIQFYPDSKTLAKTVAGFLAEGFQLSHAAVVIAAPAHLAMIIEQLGRDGFEYRELRRAGLLQTYNARTLLSAFMVNGMPDPLLFKSNAATVLERLCAGRDPAPIRAYGEMVDLLWQEGNQDAAIKLEILWNQLASDYNFSLLCGYAMGHFFKETRDPRYHDVCEQHSHILEAS